MIALLLCAVLAADPAPANAPPISGEASRLLKHATSVRSHHIEALEKRLEELKDNRKKPPVTNDVPTPMRAEMSRPEKAMLRKELESAIRKARDSQDVSIPTLPRRLELGSIGAIPDGHVVIEEVVNDSEMVVEIRYPPTSGESRGVVRVLLKGVSTKGLVDDRGVEMPGAFDVVDTVKNGGTIFVLKPVPEASINEFRAEMAKHLEPEKPAPRK